MVDKLEENVHIKK